MEIVIYEKNLEKGKDVGVRYNFLDCKKRAIGMLRAVLKPLIIRPPDSDDYDVNDNGDDEHYDLHVQEGLESTDVIIHKGEVLVLNRRRNL